MITKTNYDVEILVNNKPIKKYYSNGNWWVEARKGVNYEVKIKNLTNKRALAVVSIDGIDVLSGETASNESGGYVIEGYGTYTVKGFRVSNETVNLFEFSNKEQSYAVQSPDGEHSSKNTGGIGVIIWEEKERKPVYKKPLIRWPVAQPMIPEPEIWPWPSPVWPKYPPYKPRPPFQPYWSEDLPYKVTCKGADSFGDTTQSLMMCSTATRSCNLLSDDYVEQLAPDMGTKFSDTSVTDKVTTTEFERARIAEQIFIYYASKKMLNKMGIALEPEPKIVLPTLFKGNFCKAPKRS